MKGSPIVLLMLLAIGLIGALAYIDAERESAAALSDFAQQQSTLARSLAATLNARLMLAYQDALAVAQIRSAGHVVPRSIVEPYLSVVLRRTGTPPGPVPSPGQRAVRLSIPVGDSETVDLTASLSTLLTDLRTTESGKRVLLLLRPPDGGQFYASDGRWVEDHAVSVAADTGADFLRVSPADADHLGMPARTTLAGLARIDAGPAGRWVIAAVANAEDERDRERWARWRLILSLVTASGLVLTFGGLAMRKQRGELLLQHRLALADIRRRCDDRLERAGRAATMGVLAAGVAQEISTPLGIIASRAEQLLPKVASDERASTNVRIISEQTDRIHRVIRGLLGLVRGDRPTAEPIPAATLVQDAAVLVAHRFEMADVHLEVEATGPLPTVHGDPRLIEHALVNLLLSACDASKPGGEVKMRARAADGGRTLAIDVCDDGPGRVGDNAPGTSYADAGGAPAGFFSTKLKGHATGLGLGIAREIVARHRGSLRLEPIVPFGTRAVITIPTTGEASQRVEGDVHA